MRSMRLGLAVSTPALTLVIAAGCAPRSEASRSSAASSAGVAVSGRPALEPRAAMTSPPGCSPTENCVEISGATMRASCTPWGDGARELEFADEGKRVRIALFPVGLEAYLAGRQVTADDGHSVKSVGTASACDADGACSSFGAGTVTLRSSSGPLREGSDARAVATIRGRVIPLDVKWDPTRVLCR